LSIPTNDWSTIAYHWKKRHLLGTNFGYLQPIEVIHQVCLDDLKNIDDQKQQIIQNTLQFMSGRPANNILLTGSRGTGKSSLIKGILTRYAPQGLRLIEVSKDDLSDLADIARAIYGRSEYFIIFCDDLSFENADTGYKALKVALDGSLESDSSHMLIYATSNRRHLIPEYFEENRQYSYQDDEIHPADSVEEKISLSERFGLWLSFYPFNQDEYWEIASTWLLQLGLPKSDLKDAKKDALRWALQRGSRSGRVAWQFAKNYVGMVNQDEKKEKND
jgi:predicted AAA+ superfamily ATPase